MVYCYEQCRLVLMIRMPLPVKNSTAVYPRSDIRIHSECEMSETPSSFFDRDRITYKITVSD